MHEKYCLGADYLFLVCPSGLSLTVPVGQHFVTDSQNTGQNCFRKRALAEKGRPWGPVLGRNWAVLLRQGLTQRYSVDGIIQNNKFYFYKTFHTNCTHAHAHAALTRAEASPPLRLHGTHWQSTLRGRASAAAHLRPFHKLQKKGSLESMYKE